MSNPSTVSIVILDPHPPDSSHPSPHPAATTAATPLTTAAATPALGPAVIAELCSRTAPPEAASAGPAPGHCIYTTTPPFLHPSLSLGWCDHCRRQQQPHCYAAALRLALPINISNYPHTMTSITQLLSPWPVTKHSIVLREQHYPPPTSTAVPDPLENMQQPPPASANDLTATTADTVTGSAESDGGGDNNSDGRKGYGKRELSTSKRAAQNRAAQVGGGCDGRRRC